MSHPDSHALIIGGTRGIGRSLVGRFLADGYQVSVLARRTGADTEQISHPNARFWQADITDNARIKSVLNEVIQEKGKIDTLVFLQRYRGEGDCWDGEMSVSLEATKDIINILVDEFTSEGSIVIVNSNASEIVVDEQPLSYHIAKAALLHLVRYYAVKLGSRNIRVNGVCPITTLKKESKEYYLNNTKLMNMYKEIIPLGRLGTAEEVGNVIAFLCSTQSSFVTGQNIIVDGGISLRGHEALSRILTK